MLKNIEIIGILATIIGAISIIPVANNVYKTQKTNNFPYKTLYYAIISNLLWIIYGLYISTYSNVISGILYFIIYCFILYTKWKNK
jgi:uncharacterized protein with PQ loop repeat